MFVNGYQACWNVVPSPSPTGELYFLFFDKEILKKPFVFTSHLRIFA